MKKFLLLLLTITLLQTVQSQDKYFTKSGVVGFDATVPKSPESIDGVNKAAICVLDTKTGNIQFSMLMKGFEFERALMQEHFNENYVESNKFPKADFKGAIVDLASVNFTKEGIYTVKVKGKLTMHGQTKDVDSEGKLTVKGGKIQVQSAFQAALSDYAVEVPQLVADKVARSAKININCLLEPLK